MKTDRVFLRVKSTNTVMPYGPYSNTIKINKDHAFCYLKHIKKHPALAYMMESDGENAKGSSSLSWVEDAEAGA